VELADVDELDLAGLVKTGHLGRRDVDLGHGGIVRASRPPPTARRPPPAVHEDGGR
jgi:hypothetical protein